MKGKVQRHLSSPVASEGLHPWGEHLVSLTGRPDHTWRGMENKSGSVPQGCSMPESRTGKGSVGLGQTPTGTWA